MSRIFASLFCLILLTASASADWVPQDGHKMHFPQTPNETGTTVMATSLPDQSSGLLLADDWECSETGPVSRIHFWGAWRNGIEGQINGFYIRICDNITGQPNMPGDVVWERYVENFVVATQPDPPGSQGWYDPMLDENLLFDHTSYFLYNLMEIPDPFIQQAGSIYWLSVTAHVADPENTKWGWNSTLDRWQDGGVWGGLDGEFFWTQLYTPRDNAPPENYYSVFFDNGQFIVGSGDDPNWPDWYEYPSGWWNVWFQDTPFIKGMNEIYLFFQPGGGDEGVTVAVSWATDTWSEQDPPPDHPPLPGDSEELYIQREIFPVIPGQDHDIYFDIPDYNPEWVSVGFLTGSNTLAISDGSIRHVCRPYLNLAFVIDGGEQADIPTIDEWGMLIMGLLLLAFGTVAVVRKRRGVLNRAF